LGKLKLTWKFIQTKPSSSSIYVIAHILNAYIIDYESVNIPSKNGKTYIQEFSYCKLDEKLFNNLFIKLPEFKKCYCSSRLNYIPNGIGTTPFNDLVKFLDIPDGIFIVKGVPKARYIQKIANSSAKIINIDEYGCPKYQDLMSFPTLKYDCWFIGHYLNHRNCALHKVLKLNSWFDSNLKLDNNNNLIKINVEKLEESMSKLSLNENVANFFKKQTEQHKLLL